MNPVVSFWTHWGDELANLATVVGMLVTGASAALAAVAIQRSRELQRERNTFEFVQSFGKNAEFKHGAMLLKQMYTSGNKPAYYSLPEEDRLAVTAVMNAYDAAAALIDRSFIDEATFLGAYAWYIQTHWIWTRHYVSEIRKHSVGGELAFSAFEDLKERAAKLAPHIASALSTLP